MQENTITLTVDTQNNGTTENLSLRRHQEGTDKSAYITPNHTLQKRDKLEFFRTMPRTNGNFKGMAKAEFKLTRDVSVPGVDETTTLTAPLIIDVSFSTPVGVTAAQALEARQRAVALLDDDAVMVNLQELLEI